MYEKHPYNFSMEFNLQGGMSENYSYLLHQVGIPMTYLEIGVYEGRTFFWIIENAHKVHEKSNKKSKLSFYAIDPHDTSEDLNCDMKKIQKNFKENLEKYYETHKDNAFNVQYIQKTSREGLMQLYQENVKCDLIYIDGDHRAGTVLSDLTFSFDYLMSKYSVAICDDTGFWRHYEDEERTKSRLQNNPRLATENFMFCNWDNCKPIFLPDLSQTGIMKL